eukprot:TRINITY_DN12566_c0_g2_i1.p1 TRINITY_DN12566_c0_g2~~TRINITY_DN12566_c0_g2_i1.p1  ORF type:complete len:353 (+),score=49.48 TRINITY_DN12566_c0_g2_i1:44-1102(+)
MTVNKFKALAAPEGSSLVEPWEYTPRPLSEFDVEVSITHCGVCHSDIHQVDNDWKFPQKRPMVPGHEIIGIVSKAGPKAVVKNGMRVGVGPQVLTCLKCKQCLSGDSQYCRRAVDCYQGVHKESGTRTHGGFAEKMIVDSRWAFPIPEALDSANAAPLLCAGMTVFSPLKRFAKPGQSVGIVGVGGLGHMALQFSAALGHKVTAISTSPDKEQFAKKLGAHSFLSSSDPAQMKSATGKLNLLLVTVSSNLPWAKYIKLLDTDGVLCLVGLPSEKIAISPFSLTFKRISVCGSALASPSETKEMLALAAKHRIQAMITEFSMTEANAVLERVRQGKPRFRDVLVQNLSQQSKL